MKSFFDHIVEGFKQAAVEGAKAAKSIVGPELQDIVIACEKETKYKVPKATVLKIFVKLPKRLPPQEVLDFLKLFADLQQEDQINPCESCEEILVPSGNATAVKVGNELENPANITLESTVSLNSTSEALNATVVDTTEATTKKHSKKKHD